jgi:peroxiredoxin
MMACWLTFAVSFPAFALGPGDFAPPFANPQLDGTYLMSKDLFRTGWVLLDFFATDCEPCVRELPLLQQLEDDLAARGLVVLVVATDQQGGAVVRPFMESRGVRLPVMIDRYRVVMERYGVESIPTLFLIGPDGTVVRKAEGFGEDAVAAIRTFLGEKLPR